MRFLVEHRRRAADNPSFSGSDGGAPRLDVVHAAWTVAVMFYVIAAFHAAVGLGAPWGAFDAGGRRERLTGRVGPHRSSGLMRHFRGYGDCHLGARRAGALGGSVIPRRHRPRWFTMVYAVIAVILNVITRSSAERALWAPVSLVLLGLITYVMVATHHHDVTPRA